MPWDSIASLIQDGIDKIWPNKADQAEAKAALLEAQNAGKLKAMEAEWDNAQAQLAVNAAEAKSQDVFVAGWRPFIGWVCGLAFFWTFVGAPMLTWLCAALGHPIQAPDLDLSQMMPVLLGMLGLGAFRSAEKIKNVSHVHD